MNSSDKNKNRYLWERYNMSWIEYVKHTQMKKRYSNKSTWEKITDKLKERNEYS